MYRATGIESISLEVVLLNQWPMQSLTALLDPIPLPLILALDTLN